MPELAKTVVLDGAAY